MKTDKAAVRVYVGIRRDRLYIPPPVYIPPHTYLRVYVGIEAGSRVWLGVKGVVRGQREA